MTAPYTDVSPQVVHQASIERFVEVVFGYLDGFVPVRILSETGTPSQKPVTAFPTTADLACTLKDRAEWAGLALRGLYVVPGTVAVPGSAKVQDIQATGVLLIDLDQGDIKAARDDLARCLGLPTLEVASGGTTEDGQPKQHLYWRLSKAATGTDLERVRALRERIAQTAGGDAAFGSIHQPIRVPGTVHGKHGKRTLVRLLEYRALEYELSDLEDGATAMPHRGPSAEHVPFAVVAVSPRVTVARRATGIIHAGGIDSETRFQGISKTIGHWLRNVRLGHCTLGEAWQAVTEYNAAMISPPWDEDRLRRDFDALLKRDIASKGAGPGTAATMTANALVALSDDALAAAFARQYGTSWKHVAAWGTWYGWTGTRWQRDETGQVRDLVRHVCRREARTADKLPEQRRIASDRTIAAVLRMASCDPSLATRTSDWDAHPMLLNTPSGVIDLATGEVLGHQPEMLQTQITAASPGAGCSRWIAFLDEITGADSAITKYLQRLSGYILTGSTKEQVFAFFHGPGANGKSVFVQTIAAVIGDYAATATLETFMTSASHRHLTELAGLRAARLVIVPETDAGHAWAEGRIKTVTGGEKIRANFMHRDHFEYTPQFKLLVAGNHRPTLSNVGEAMRRRLHLVPFEVTIPAEARDQDLSTKLLAERDGILGWMLEGCAEWRQIGLAPPPVVVDAANDYFAEEDLVTQWITDCCDVGPNRQDASNTLFGSWADWAEAAGHAKGSSKSLGEALRQRGFRNGKVGRVRGWHGLARQRAFASTPVEQ